MKTRLFIAFAILSLGCATPDASFLPARESLNRGYSENFKAAGSEAGYYYFKGKADAYRELRQEVLP